MRSDASGRTRSTLLSPALVLGLVLVPAACQETEPAMDDAEVTEEVAAEKSSPEGEAHVIEVLAADYAFGAPDSIPSGWITVRLNNEHAEEIHEIVLTRLPEGVTYQDWEETLPVWDRMSERMQAGEISGAEEVYGAAAPLLPGWFGDIEEVSGRGLVSPGRTTEKSVRLEPGTYAMVCYVKSPDGRVHASQGMSRELIVTDEESGGAEPEADVEVTIGGDEITTYGELSPGDNSVAARFEEESGGYRTIHLIRVEEDTDLEEVARWLDWYWEGGLRAPAPADFFGGEGLSANTSEGNSGYFTVEGVEPGQYAWIVWTSEGELWETFTVE